MKNLSSRPLSEAQVSLFARCPHFAVGLLYSPGGEYIAIMGVSLSQPPQVAEQFRVETNRVLRYDCQLKPNIIREEARVLKELRQDNDKVILTGDKGMAVVILDKQDCINKAWDVWWKGTHLDH